MEHKREATVRAPTTGATHGRVVEVWTRRTPEKRTREEPCLERIRRLERTGHVDEVVVREWDRTVCLDEPVDERERLARQRVADFRRWARATGARLPEFDREETVGDGRMGPVHEAQYLPSIVVAVYEDGVLRTVLPHVRGDHTHTVTEWLNGIEDGRRTTESIVR